MKLQLIFLCVTICVDAKKIPSVDQVNILVEKIREAIDNNRISVGDDNPTADISKLDKKGPDMPLIAGFVQLAFLDCIGNGNCDGCIDSDHPANNHTKIPIEFLSKIYKDNELENVMSRADLYAFAAFIALEVAPETNDQKDISQVMKDNKLAFKFGRLDCSNAPEETEDDKENMKYPDSCFSLEESVKFMKDNFGFNQEETIASMGAHTLGFIRQGLPERLSFEEWAGMWVPRNGRSSQFNNEYYTEMLEWELHAHRKRRGDQYCTSGLSSKVYLDSDISVVYKIPRNDDGYIECMNSCSYKEDLILTNGEAEQFEHCCEHAAGYDQAFEYLKDNDKFTLDFLKAMMKIVDHNQKDLEVVEYDHPVVLLKTPRW